MPNTLNAETILRSLVANGVEFVVVGGLAMITHGSSHVTDDLDICFAVVNHGIQNSISFSRR